MHTRHRLPAAPASWSGLRPAVVLVAIGALASCTGATGGENDQVAIGLATNVREQVAVRQGVELAILHLNAERPRTSRPFVMRSPSVGVSSAVQMAMAMRDDPEVAGVVGHTDSGGTLEAVPIYEDSEHRGENAVVAIAPTATSPTLSGRSEWLFRVCPSDVIIAARAAHFAVDSLGARRATIVYRNDLFGRGWTRAFIEAYRERGGTVIGRAPHLVGMTDWEAYAGLVRKSAPDLVLFAGGPKDAAPFVRALRAIGANPAVLGSDAVSELAAQGKEFDGIYFTALFLSSRVESASAREFVAEFRRRYRTAPDQRAALAYDAAMLIGRAVLAVGPDRAKVRDYVAQIGTKRPPYDGITGRIAFDAQHDVVNKPVAIARLGAR